MQHSTALVPGYTANSTPITVTAPFDDAQIATIETVDAQGVEHALALANSIANDRNRWLPAAQRIGILEKAANIMQSRFEELAIEAAREGGKPLIDSRVEVARAIDGVKNCIECIRNDAGHEIPMGLNAASSQRLAFTHKEPIGTVVAISAFNHPLNLIVHQVGPAVAAGCPVIVKPADDTPLSCMRFISILHEAGLPAEYAQALLTDTLDTATKLVSDARVDFLSFIGSAKVGWMLRSKLAPGARCALEHGGAAPVIIAADANLEDAIPLLAKSSFYHAGQVCVSTQRIFAHSSIANKVAEQLAAAGQSMQVGDPTSEDTAIGPLIRHREVQRVDEWVQAAVQEGATLLCGGKAISASCYPATVLLNPPVESTVSQQEIFGPVVCVYSYDDIDSAIAQANAVPYSFQAAVFSQNIDTALHAYRNLNASAVMINDQTSFRVDWMPFAGLKQSGHGVGGIPYTYEDMQIDKMMVIRSKVLK